MSNPEPYEGHTPSVTTGDVAVEYEIAKRWPYIANRPEEQGKIAARHRVNKGPAADAMAGLIETLLENEPDEPISDAGHTVLDLWRHEARAALAAYREQSNG